MLYTPFIAIMSYILFMEIDDSIIMINGYKWLDQWLQVTWSMVILSDLSNGYAIQTHSSMWIATFSNMNIMQKYIDTIREVTN